VNDRFTFTITDAARFLGKSPVTLRDWERQKLIPAIPRDSGGDRKLDLQFLRILVTEAHSMHRITIARRRLVESIITLLELIETENKR